MRMVAARLRSFAGLIMARLTARTQAIRAPLAALAAAALGKTKHRSGGSIRVFRTIKSGLYGNACLIYSAAEASCAAF